MDIAHFKENLFKIKETFFFDKNEYLREKTSNTLKVIQVIHEAEILLKGSHKDDKYFLYGTLGNLYSIIGQPKKAFNSLTYCLNYSVEDRNITRQIVTLIRLGEALKYDTHHKEALLKFNEALNLCITNKIDAYIDFALQHKGKCLMELSLLKEAEECFLEALHLRELKEDFSLINSTKQALNFLYKLQQESSIDDLDVQG
ncbi:hypothetical protein [Ureibacillus sinduriensis]|uniref:Tetratricopeptide repeat protein n=1 Tax=Ureibacillus sinduriensis BLB-1 = JCM 15800 TaxID=1384057 RepID=A0A0A3HRD3_9BACL|nr:hypothetical protein [Ureibacillus sinduriensis]KGR74959.1 hypothetical protein CD33_14605 [Ureibacillus sinduriensis BLB-1 = JCM 15800]